MSTVLGVLDAPEEDAVSEMTSIDETVDLGVRRSELSADGGLEKASKISTLQSMRNRSNGLLWRLKLHESCLYELRSKFHF